MLFHINILDLFETAKYDNDKELLRCVMDYMTLKEAGEKWGISARMINCYCAKGRIPGAVKMASVWLIPKNARKPVDRRKNRRVDEDAGGKNE